MKPFAEESLKFEFTKSVLCFCMLVVNPLAVEITFSLIELQKVGVQQSLKVVNHITFSFINSLESFVEAGVLFPWSNFSNSIAESWSTSISKWGNQICKSVSHTFQFNKWRCNHVLFVRDPFCPYDERLAELQSSGKYVRRPFAHHAAVVISFEHLRIFVPTIPYLLEYCNLGVPLDALLLSPMYFCLQCGCATFNACYPSKSISSHSSNLYKLFWMKYST